MAGHDVVDNVKWRSKTRSVVYFNMFMSFLLLIFGIILVSVFSIEDWKIEKPSTVMTWFILIFTTLALITTVIEMVSSVMLVIATKLGRDSETALRRATCYRIVNFILLLLVVTASALIYRWEFLFVQLLWRVLLLFVVSMFIEELK